MTALLVFASQAFALPATSDEFDSISIGGSQLYAGNEPARDTQIAELQVLLDRKGFSPGAIDGRSGPRLDLALAALETAEPDSAVSAGNIDAVRAGLRETGGDAFFDYEIKLEDTAGPFTPEIPVLYVAQAQLERVGFRSAREALAEKFHIDEDYLAELNPGADFSRPGTRIRVPAVGRDLQKQVARIEADKRRLQLRAFDSEGRLIAAYPASIGSEQTPSPSGTHTVKNKAQNPAYTYDPEGSAQPGLSKGLVVVPPGPNGPVGNAWIGLSKKTYGIHGTPEPSLVGIAQSVGCVRLTNWDALELARLVRRGVPVTFID